MMIMNLILLYATIMELISDNLTLQNIN